MTYRLLPIIVITCLTACTSKTDSSANLAEESRQLRSELDLLKIAVETQAQVYSDRIVALESSDGVKPAYLVLGEGYGTATTHIGTTFLVAWDDSKPQGDGTLITLRIGNPYTASFSGISISYQYSRRSSAPASTQDTPPSISEQIEAKVTDTILPGKWNRVTFRIAGVKPDEITTMRVTLTADLVSLGR